MEHVVWFKSGWKLLPLVPTVCRCWRTSMQLCLCWKFALAAAIRKSSLKKEPFPKPFHDKDTFLRLAVSCEAQQQLAADGLEVQHWP